ncbi:MAG TPA: hypothetical protein VFV93_08090 [Thermomicrobiales bacterium]|nr:hypothetical protein [Thermomicrobiales bacterium]
MLVVTTQERFEDDRDEWAAMEEECIDFLPHHRRMWVMEIADDTGLSEFQALMVTLLAESIQRTASEPEF